MASNEHDDVQSVGGTIPLNLLVEVVEARYARRQTATMRWWATIWVSIFALFLTIAGMAFAWWYEESRLDDAKRSARLRELPSPTAVEQPDASQSAAEETMSSTLTPQASIPVALGPDSRQYYSIQNEDGVYAIETDALQDIDPIIDLYRVDSTELHLVASNDDGGEGLNARLVVRLTASVRYLLEVRELFGNPGRVQVSLRKIG